MEGRGGRKWVDLHPFDSVSPSSRGRGREATPEHQNILPRERSARRSVPSGEKKKSLLACLLENLIGSDFHTVDFGPVALDAQCFFVVVFLSFSPLIQGHMREREREDLRG